MGRRSTAIGAAMAAMSLAVAASASAAPPTDTSALRAAVTKQGLAAHLQALQKIANQNQGNRATGTSGHDASAAYVERTLKAAGYATRRDPFQATIFEEVTQPQLSSTPAPPGGWTYGENFLQMDFSQSGSVTGQVVSIDFAEPNTTASNSTSGCEAADFTQNLSGKIALVQRGTCDFGIKVQNAQAAGAAAVLIFNEGTLLADGTPDPERNGLIFGTLSDYAANIRVPVLDLTYAAGRILHDAVAAGQAPTATVVTNNRIRTLRSYNVIADTKTGRADRVVAVGGHLDSVEEGPGINDNGSGIASILETAVQMSKLGIAPVNKVRFMFFAGEEQGLLGSDAYVADLVAGDDLAVPGPDAFARTEGGVKDVAAMLNFDMLGSTNFIRYVYDGDGSSEGIAGPNGSGTVERVFLDYYAAAGLPTFPTAFDGRSDYDAFTAAGIPAGGTFTGAEHVKTREEQSVFGGIVGAQLDPCYHAACDTLANVDQTLLAESADAVAHAALTFAMTTSAVNGTDNGSPNSTKDAEWHGSRRVR